MQSEATSPQSSNQAAPQIDTPIPTQTGKVSTTEILSGMQKGNTALEFIQKNLNALSDPPSQPLNPQAVADKVQKELEAKPAESSPVAANPADPTPVIGEESAPAEAPTPAVTEVEDDGLDVPDAAVAENFKKLRTKAKETAKALKELETKHAEVSTKLAKYETGEVVPELIQQKENEIARLKRYESLVDLKTSTEYQDAFVKPLTAAQEQLKTIFKEYNVPESLIDEALNKKNRAELNRFLIDHFDEVGALEIKEIVNTVKNISGKAQEAEKEPARVLADLQQQNQAMQQVKSIQRKSHIASIAKDSWSESLFEIRQEKKALELIRKDNDPDFNQKVVDPILTQAATEYGKLVTELAEAGLTELSKPVAKALSKAILLAHASAVALHTRDSAMQQVRTLEASTKRTHSLLRPAIGGGTPSSGGAPAMNMNSTPAEDARGLINNILSGKQ